MYRDKDENLKMTKRNCENADHWLRQSGKKKKMAREWMDFAEIQLDLGKWNWTLSCIGDSAGGGKKLK